MPSHLSPAIYYFIRYERGGYERYLPFLRKKSLRLLVPYVFVCAVWVVPVSAYFFKYDWSDIVTKFVLGESPAQLWFVLMLFWVFAISWPMSEVFRKHTWLSAAVVAVIYGMGLVGPIIIPNYFKFFTGCQYLVYFWIGFKIRQKMPYFRSKTLILMGGGNLLINMGLLFTSKSLPNNNIILHAVSILLYFLSTIAGALFAYALLLVWARRINWQESRIFKNLLKTSFPIYLFHQQFIYPLIPWVNGTVNPIIASLMIFFIVMGVSWLVSTLLLSNRYTRPLIGA